MRTKTKNFFEDLFVLLIIGVIIFFVYIFFFSDDEKSETLLTNNIVQEKIEETKPIINEIKGQIENRVEKIVSVTKQEEQKVEEVSQNIEENPIHKHEVMNNEIKEEEKKIEETSLNHTNHQENMAQTVAPIEETKTEVIAQTSNPIEISKNNEIVISEEAGKIETKTSDSQIQDIQTNENENRDTNDKTNVDQFFKNFERKVYDNINKNVDKSALRSGQFVNIRVTFLKDGGYEQLIYVSGNMGHFNLIKSSIEESFPVVIEDSIKGHFPRYYRMKIEF
ncbi:hypothetical protein [Aliarcobacter butzleri]|uniref:hypothetical protein n=1 Tax=Aliarcobacter butzleri TaxID=28197 RepID=UPI001EDC76D4|nr:hypothetical protein [Aliarcobacter butzleri]MCG3683563.1 hypothetical protein [Aliarcobacter butzleri]MCT7576259.1 hypothetical protein [Aliarcobacter butzleri]MCT7591936.1 hypothetical protein [Aliarcobacter butzleri]